MGLRWNQRHGPVPEGADAQMATLRELQAQPIHRQTRTSGDEVAGALKFVSMETLRVGERWRNGRWCKLMDAEERSAIFRRSVLSGCEMAADHGPVPRKLSLFRSREN